MFEDMRKKEHGIEYFAENIQEKADECSGLHSTSWYLDFVSELFDLIDSSVVLVGQLPQLLLAPLRHLLQVGALILSVAERALQESGKTRSQRESKRL